MYDIVFDKVLYYIYRLGFELLCTFLKYLFIFETMLLFYTAL